jgi:hypothetical protein
MYLISHQETGTTLMTQHEKESQMIIQNVKNLGQHRENLYDKSGQLAGLLCKRHSSGRVDAYVCLSGSGVWTTHFGNCICPWTVRYFITKRTMAHGHSINCKSLGTNSPYLQL